MIYYGLVEKIKDDHKSGIYGRRALRKDEKLNIDFSSIAETIGVTLLLLRYVVPLSSIVYAGYKIYKYFTGANLITLQHEDSNSENLTMIFPNELLEGNYDVEKSKEVLYGLFDSFDIRSKAFKSMMLSKGGASLVIVERDKVKHNHYGGKHGKFNCGLYIPHPKDNKMLIPLDNSNELIKTFILEETIRAFEALGAKKITIEDKTIIDANINGGDEKVNGGANVNYDKQILREKEFGKGTFDPDRALKESLFIHDYPNIITTINARIKGNQTIERFTETINLSAGLDVNVLNLFSGNANFNYKRTWFFEVEFYDKNE